MINEVELLEELPYYRTLQKPPPPQHGPPRYPTVPRGLRLDAFAEDSAIAIIAPDTRAPTADHYSELYAPAPCLDILVSILSYAFDMGSDLVVCYVLFAEGRVLWAALTAAFLLLSTAVVNVLSFHWYVRNQQSPASIYTSVSKLTWLARAIAHILCMGLVYRMVQEVRVSACGGRIEERDRRSVAEARKRRNALQRLQVREDRRCSALALLAACLQSAPQLVLQLYVLAHRSYDDSHIFVLIQGACATASLFQLSWSITMYNCALHRTQSGKKRASHLGKALQFLWHFCTVGSRACTLALFTKEFHYWLFPFCIGHWGVMSVWVMHQQTRFCRRDGQPHQCREYVCNMAVGVAYVIYYLNVKAEPTRYKYSAYYAVVFAENCALMTLWFLRSDPGVWYRIPALVAVFSSFASGIVFMLFYYGFCHRTLKQNDEKRSARCC